MEGWFRILRSTQRFKRVEPGGAGIGVCNPVEQVSEYAVGAKIVSEPAFAWWVPYTLKQRKWIIGKINACFAKKMH